MKVYIKTNFINMIVISEIIYATNMDVFKFWIGFMMTGNSVNLIIASVKADNFHRIKYKMWLKFDVQDKYSPKNWQKQVFFYVGCVDKFKSRRTFMSSEFSMYLVVRLKVVLNNNFKQSQIYIFLHNILSIIKRHTRRINYSAIKFCTHPKFNSVWLWNFSKLFNSEMFHLSLVVSFIFFISLSLRQYRSFLVGVGLKVKQSERAL